MPIERSPSRTQNAVSPRTIDDETHGVVAGTMAETKTNLREVANVNAVSVVKLPPFWRDNSFLWFAQVEAAFAINRITSDESRYRYVIVHLEQTVLPLGAELLTNPPEGEK